MKQASFAAAVSAAALFIAAAPAQAVALPECLTDGSAPGAIDCRGYFAGNLISGNATDRDTQLTNLQSMGFGGTVPAALFNSPLKIGLNKDTALIFPTVPLLFGQTFVGIHWGGSGGRSALYEFNFLTPVSSIAILAMNTGGSSNAVLYATQAVPPPPPAVPEPASWAMMIGGLGLVGAAMRRRKSAVSFA